jgi:tetratricopeptide (TPR) repeat protein
MPAHPANSRTEWKSHAMWAAATLTLTLLIAPLPVRADDAPTRINSALPAAASQNPIGGQSLASTAQADSAKRHIQELISQLGDPRYATRRAAATELRQIGPEAFDLLHTATTSSDPEVAASSRYLLRQIAVRWVQSDDSPAVRAVLRDYDPKPDNGRLSSVQELAQLKDGEGVAGLCRIARFDRSPVVSRTAALAIIRPIMRTALPTRVDPELAEAELGDSSRIAAIWLRQYIVQLRDPAASVASWQIMIDEEVSRLDTSAADTSPAIVSGLLWNLADVHRQLDNRSAMFGVVDRMIGIDPDSVEKTAVELLEWISEHQAWDVLDQFLAKHQSKLEQAKRPLYHAALARAKQGKSDEADQLAAKAAELDSQRDLESFITAKELEEHNQFDWAQREYRRNIDPKTIASHEGILARVYLARMLHDYEKHGEAAEVLAPLAKAVENEGQIGQLYTELQRYYRRRLELPESDPLSGLEHYYRALQYRDAKDYEKEREELKQAIKFDPNNPDILIAMYRVPGSDDKWMSDVRQRITNLSRQVEQEIDERPNEPDGYNQWAWLVSNTEGDFKKAIRYSHRSLELIPRGSGQAAGASFLDTLGRCYFAAGDIENAVKYQRQAVAKVDYMQVMNRQLAQFEKALAEKRGAGSEEQGASKIRESNQSQ